MSVSLHGIRNVGLSIVWALLVATLGACATGQTRVQLLPEASGSTGAIAVSAVGQTAIADRPYQRVTVEHGSPPRTQESTTTEAQLRVEHPELMAAEPSPPVSYLLYFRTGSTELVDASQALITPLIDQIKLRIPTEVKIIGHTDTTGTDQINDKLSLDRARAVEKLLRARLPGLGPIIVQSFGSKDLLIRTPANVDEPRNRRVEVLVL